MRVQPDHQRWVIIAEFFRGQDNQWLDDFIVDERFTFEKVVFSSSNRDWHQGRSKLTPLTKWFRHLRHAHAALRKRPDGIITCFPQLAICAALWKGMSRSKPPIIAYNFNLGELRPGLRQSLARGLASQIDCFVVHSPQEVMRYAEYLGVAQQRIQFVPLQRGKINILRKEDTDTPFILSMGSAHRDYPTLIHAAERLNLPTFIVTRASDIALLPQNPNVTFLSGMSEQECLELLARARICVTPVANMTTASGQVTFINAMQLGVPVVATRCPGTVGYIEHGGDGLLVAPFDVDDMVTAIDRLWQDSTLRMQLAEKARVTAHDRFSDQAAADRLVEIIKRMS